MHKLGPALAVAAALATAGPAQPGAWPRDEGTGFLAFTSIPRLDGDGFSVWSGLFAEYGATRRLTLGFDGDLQMDRSGWSALAFARWDLAPDAATRRAVTLGLGLRGGSGRPELVLRPGLAFGRGFELGGVSGWADAEAQVLHAPASGWTAWKLDATFGLKPRPGRLAILQVQSGLYPEGAQIRLVPSLVQRIGPALHLELGAAVDLLEPRSAGLKLGCWVEF